MKLSLGIGIGLNPTRRTAQIITRISPPTFGPYVEGDAPADVYGPGIYASSAGEIASVVPAWTVNSTSAGGDTVLEAGDVVRLVSETVTDDADPANERVFNYSGASTVSSLPLPDAPEIEDLTLDAEEGVFSFSLPEGSLPADVFWMVGEDAERTAEQVEAATGADLSGSFEAVTGNESEEIDVSTLPFDTTLYLHVVAKNAAGFGAVQTVEFYRLDDQPATWTLEGASYVDQSPALAAGGDMRTVEFTPDGMRAFAVFRSSELIRQYDLAAPWDILNPTESGSHDFSGYITTGTREDSVAHGLFIRKDTGTTAWLWNRTEVWVLTLSTPWDITTASQTGYFFFGSGNPTGVSMSRGHDLDWKADGTRWFVEDRSNGRVYQWDCTTPWDITTSVAAGSYVIPNVDEVRGIELQPDGARLFMMHTTAMEAREYHLSTPWDVTTASLVRSFSVAGQSSNPRSLTFRPDGSEFFVGDATSRRVHVYEIEESETAVTPTSDGALIENLPPLAAFNDDTPTVGGAVLAVVEV